MCTPTQSYILTQNKLEKMHLDCALEKHHEHEDRSQARENMLASHCGKTNGTKVQFPKKRCVVSSSSV